MTGIRTKMFISICKAFVKHANSENVLTYQKLKRVRLQIDQFINIIQLLIYHKIVIRI